MANYTPACIYSLPQWLADRIVAQGLSNTIIALTAEVANTAGDGGQPDSASNTILNGYLTTVTAAKDAGQGG